MSKFTVSIGLKEFDITLDEDFYEFFKEDFSKTFDQTSPIETKELLNAFVQKSYDEYMTKKEYKKISDKIDMAIVKKDI